MEGSASVQVPVSYNCEFINAWTKERHPANFPNGDHWSPMLIASHSKGYTMWAQGAKATAGVESVAEDGSTSQLRNELDNAGFRVKDYGTASSSLFPSGSSQSMRITDKLEMDRGHTLISAISMIACSPDWFSGLNKYRPVKDARWLQSFTVNSYPYDAGTENGSDYDCSNTATSPTAPISRFRLKNIPSTNVFLNTAKTGVLPVAQWSCTLNALACEETAGGRYFRRNLRDENGDVVGVKVQRCRFLKTRSRATINRICNQSSPRPNIPPASEVCRVTCQTCS